MTTGRHRPARQDRADRSVLRSMAWSAATAAAIATAFSPMPALAAPVPAYAPGDAIGVPDSGSRPVPAGALIMPGEVNAVPTVPVAVPTGTTPLMAKIEAKRVEVALLADQLLKLSEERRLADEQLVAAESRLATAVAALAAARANVEAAAAQALKDAAGLPPEFFGSDLHGLDPLSRIQRGDSVGQQAAARELNLAEAAEQTAQVEYTTARTRADELDTEYGRLETEHEHGQEALRRLERKNAAAIAAAERAEEERERRIGEGYLGGDVDGKGANPDAVVAVEYALDQIGDPYRWAAEGPDRFDCSGLMWAAYREANGGTPPIPRVSRDQYWATRYREVGFSALLPGDLLFFSATSGWEGIHHVAMYVGDGKMVEAARAGTNVRVTTVRWSRLFRATRVYPAVDEPTAPKPKPPTKPTKPTKPPSSPSTPPSSPSTPPSSPSTPPSSPSTPPSSPSTPPSPRPSATTPSPHPTPDDSPTQGASAPPQPTPTTASAPGSGSAPGSEPPSASGSASGSGSAGGDG